MKRIKALPRSGLSKKNVGSEEHGNYDPGILVAIKEHQLQGNRDLGTVFTLPHFAKRRGAECHQAMKRLTLRPHVTVLPARSVQFSVMAHLAPAVLPSCVENVFSVYSRYRPL